jgi:hypothetical protein
MIAGVAGRVLPKKSRLRRPRIIALAQHPSF